MSNLPTDEQLAEAVTLLRKLVGWSDPNIGKHRNDARRFIERYEAHPRGLRLVEIDNACTHEFRPIDSSGQVACIYCNERPLHPDVGGGG